MTSLMTPAGGSIRDFVKFRVMNLGTADPGSCALSLNADGTANSASGTELFLGTMNNNSMAFSNLNIATGASAYLCFSLVFPTGLTNQQQTDLQNQTSTTTFTFATSNAP